MRRLMGILVVFLARVHVQPGIPFLGEVESLYFLLRVLKHSQLRAQYFGGILLMIVYY